MITIVYFLMLILTGLISILSLLLVNTRFTASPMRGRKYFKLVTYVFSGGGFSRTVSGLDTFITL
jgi:hypothetical protein